MHTDAAFGAMDTCHQSIHFINLKLEGPGIWLKTIETGLELEVRRLANPGDLGQRFPPLWASAFSPVERRQQPSPALLVLLA